MRSIFKGADAAEARSPAPIGETTKKSTRQVDPQTTPIEFALPDGGRGGLKVDLAIVAGDFVLIAGWRLGGIDLAVRVAGEPTLSKLVAIPRQDVNKHYAAPDNDHLGFVLRLKIPTPSSEVSIEWIDAAGNVLGSAPIAIGTVDQATEASISSLGPARGLVASHYAPFSAEWCRAVANPSTEPVASARGYLEAAVAVQGSNHVVVCGWVATEPDAVAWLEDERGQAYPLDNACWRARDDVYRAVGAELGIGALHSGFVAHMQTEQPASRIRLKALTSEGVHLLADTANTILPPDPVAVSRWLFGIQVQEGRYDQRFERVSGPLLEALIERSQSAWPQLPLTVRALGKSPAQPRVSIVVPLYARYDFVESQMVEWARDPWIRQHAELIYVVDDPTLVEPFRLHAEELHRLYGVPFRWVWGSVNRGFSGANNLGASVATGECLLFLNSDVFPQGPGWLESMVDVLTERPDIGAVGPRLVFAEGGIQHAGMRFERMEEFGVWINRHPYMGLDPELDPHSELTIVPAVTGACLLVRRSDFEAIGRWDTGYLIGDFEDSDFCLKLRERGLHIGYLPSVQLTHLERQSFASLGSGDYRQRVTLWNALRHQERWKPLLEASVEVAA